MKSFHACIQQLWSIREGKNIDLSVQMSGQNSPIHFHNGKLWQIMVIKNKVNAFMPLGMPHIENMIGWQLHMTVTVVITVKY